MGTKCVSLGTSTNTTALSAVSIAALENVYVTIDGTMPATTTGTVEISFNGSTWESYGSSSSVKGLVGPLPRCLYVRGKNSAVGSGSPSVTYALSGRRAEARNALPVPPVVAGNFANITSAASCAAVDVTNCGTVDVWVKSADFVGTYQVEVSFDAGTTWGIYGTPAVVASGATSTLITVPQATQVRVTAAAYTSGTLSARYGTHKQSVV